MVMALSSSVLMSSQLSSWTKPTWLASMKQGSHIMLQRLVRSTVSTEPRPWVMVLRPVLVQLLVVVRADVAAGEDFFQVLEKSVSIAITSSKWPWIGQSFTIRILPSRSMICALISPTFSFISTSSGGLPSRICWRISGTHRGHSESVSRGQPSGGLVFSQDFSSGFSDHFGVGEGFCLIWLRLLNTTHAPLAATVTAFSTYLTGLCMRSRFPVPGIRRQITALPQIPGFEPGCLNPEIALLLRPSPRDRRLAFSVEGLV